MQKVKYYKCPHCGKKYQSLQTWGNHVKDMHPNLIPEGWSYGRYFYYIQTGKKEGHCIICKNPTDWQESTMKYARFCNNPKCKEEYRKMFKDRMINKYGKVTLLDDPEQQRKMLANKKISGTYTFKSGKKVTYTGTYELDFLKMCETFLKFDGSELMMPSPHTYQYYYKNDNDKENEGEKFYIPDAFIPSLNLEIEIKQNTSKHPKILRVDKVKEAQKDAVMANIEGINYVKIVDKDYSDFFDAVRELGSIATESASLESLKIYPQKESPIYVPKERLDLNKNSYSIDLNFATYQDLKNHCKDLNGIRMTESSIGEIFLDPDKKDAIIGFYMINHMDYSDFENKWLQMVYVAKEYRNHGYGDQILDRAIRKESPTNCKVPFDNPIMMRMIESRNFVEYARTPEYVLFYTQYNT